MKKNRIMKTSFTLMLTGLLFMLPAAVMAGGQSESPQTEQHTESVGGAGTVEELKEFAGAGTSIESTVNEDGVLELTVDRAVEIAMDNNLQLKSSAIDTRIKERKADYAWNRFVPSVQASGTLGRMNEAQQQMEFDPLAPTGIVMTEAPQWSVSAGLDLSLTLNMAMFNGIRATQLDYQAGRISLEQARQRVARDVKKSFYNLLLMQENRQLMVENI
ncbi:MAG: TolC family protein, partial [Spirochaetaceae bacterium]|nr:TolC family protein [Spirochaetaceae bacterium]MCF7951235.1 TolC family protein [Spirochaetaceae bacterium]